MKQEEIKLKIKEIEEIIKKTKLSMINYDYVDKLLDIHTKLWTFLYFKSNQEENFLKK